MNTNEIYQRYQRQIILKDFGKAGQDKLLSAKVLVIGAGGLGCPCLQYLAGAGIGTIGIVDDDVVSVDNLHRQILYSGHDIGASKALKASEALKKLNSTISIISYIQRLTTSNALSIFRDYDVVIDGTDNFATRYLVNDACVLLNKPLVYGAISQFEGQVAIFNASDNNNVNYRDLFPQPPKEGEILNCAEAGVIGVLPGIIGTMMANECIKLISGIGQPLKNTMLTYNTLNNQIYQLALHSKAGTAQLIPANAEAFEKMDYEWLCATQHNQPEISPAEFNQLLATENLLVLDVREYDERPEITEFPYHKIPLGMLKENIPASNADTIVVFCQSGKRSMQAAQWLFDTFGDSKKIYSLKGGILNWIN